MAITKLLDVKEQITLTMKLKFLRNRATLKVTNSTKETGRTGRFKIIRVLQSKAGCVATKFEQAIPL